MDRRKARRRRPKDAASLKNKEKLKRYRIKQQSKSEETVQSVVERYSQLKQMKTAGISSFSDFPLSTATLKGLDECRYEVPTEIQRDSLPFSLTGSDVVGAAKTGSGKTLALVVPLLECLWRAQWRSDYGLGALIISPTRELALQTFTCINNIGKYHNFSCALLIGGTDVDYEKNRLGSINIIVCTPGRLLQHMDENEQLNCDQLQILVIDEADRILDMGFSKQVNAIVANLPADRQTLLFSATQTKNVKDLTRVCTKDPVFVSVHENSSTATPDKLKQWYMLCEEHEKINALWSFMKMYNKDKILGFVSSCKQARFITEAFCHLRPGFSVMGLWGTMNQQKRVDVFQNFENCKSGILICTDVASRGLDFSKIDWVVQVDAPAAADDYIHRVGRTARMNRSGNALLFLTPNQETGMVAVLRKKNITLELQRVDPAAIVDIKPKLQTVLAQFTELNGFAQKSIVAYLRSLYVMRDKSIFNVEKVDAKLLAESYGLMSVPRVRFLSKQGVKTKDKNLDPQPTALTGRDVKIKANNITCVPVNSFVGHDENDDNSEADLFEIKSADVFNVLKSEGNAKADKNDYDISRKTSNPKKKPKLITREELAKKIINKGVKLSTRKVFSEENYDQDNGNEDDRDESGGLDLSKAKEEIKKRDAEDAVRFRELRKKRKKEKAELKKKKRRAEEELDLGADESDNEQEIDLDWLPDPDEVRKRYAEELSAESADDLGYDSPPQKKTKRDFSRIKQAEAEALALLNPF